MRASVRLIWLAVTFVTIRHIFTILSKYSQMASPSLEKSIVIDDANASLGQIETRTPSSLPEMNMLKDESALLFSESNHNRANNRYDTNENVTSSVAYVVSVTSCENTVFDGAAVLAASIAATQQPGYKLIALVYNASAASCRKGFEVLGYQVMPKGIPFDPKKMKRETMTRVLRGGCCGATEYLKLYAYLLLDFDVVVHLDIDVILLKALDPLIDTIVKGSNTTHSIRTIPARQVLPQTVDFLFVREYNTYSMIEPTNRIKFGVQGAFFLLRPSREIFDDMIQVLLNTTFSSKKGWNSMGFGGYWGSAQIQGFLSYYYYILNNLTSAVELDPCRYNTLGFDKRYLLESNLTHLCRTGEATCEDCSATPLEEIYVAHLSLCKKPWWCPSLNQKKLPRLCIDFYRLWFELRRQVDQDLFGQGQLREVVLDNEYSQSSLGYCSSEGKTGYRPIAFEQPGLFFTNSSEGNQ